MKLSTAFRQGAEIISGKGVWAQGMFGYYGEGPLANDDRGRYCLLGAVGKAMRVDPAFIGTAFLQDLVARFNDDRSTTQDDAVMCGLMLAEYFAGEGF